MNNYIGLGNRPVALYESNRQQRKRGVEARLCPWKLGLSQTTIVEELGALALELCLSLDIQQRQRTRINWDCRAEFVPSRSSANCSISVFICFYLSCIDVMSADIESVVLEKIHISEKFATSICAGHDMYYSRSHMPFVFASD